MMIFMTILISQRITLRSGITYEILKPLSNDQKETILARTEGLTADDLDCRAQFTVLNFTFRSWSGHSYQKIFFMSTAMALFRLIQLLWFPIPSFGGGYLDIEITDNAEFRMILI